MAEMVDERMEIDEEFIPINQEVTDVIILSDGKSTRTYIGCNDVECPYNGVNSPILRSNASILLTDEKGESYTLDENHSGVNGHCPHGITHRVITKNYHSG